MNRGYVYKREEKDLICISQTFIMPVASLYLAAIIRNQTMHFKDKKVNNYFLKHKN